MLNDTVSLDHIYRSQKVYGSIFNQFYVIGPKADEFSKMKQNNGHYAVQDHSRSKFWYRRKPYAT